MHYFSHAFFVLTEETNISCPIVKERDHEGQEISSVKLLIKIN